MILESLTVAPDELAERTGWTAMPQGLCKGETCVPAPDVVLESGELSVPILADRLQMPLITDAEHNVHVLGPESGGTALTTATAADIELPDVDGNPFALSSLHGRKVLLVSWASW